MSSIRKRHMRWICEIVTKRPGVKSFSSLGATTIKLPQRAENKKTGLSCEHSGRGTAQGGGRLFFITKVIQLCNPVTFLFSV
jgi:hypothetical protein